MPEFYTWTILLINQLGEIGEKQFSVFGSRGGQIFPLNAHTPLANWFLRSFVEILIQNHWDPLGGGGVEGGGGDNMG